MSTSDTSIDNTTGIAGEPSPVPMRYTTLNTGAKILWSRGFWLLS